MESTKIYLVLLIACAVLAAGCTATDERHDALEREAPPAAGKTDEEVFANIRNAHVLYHAALDAIDVTAPILRRLNAGD